MRTDDALWTAWRAGREEARTAWRHAWPPLAVSAAGQALVFAAGRVDLPEAAAQVLGWTGALLYMAALGPKLARLHAPHDRPAQSRRWGRLLATAVALCGLAAGLAAVLLAATVAMLLLLRPLGSVPAGPFGRLGVGLLMLLPAIAAAVVASAAVVGRFAVTLAADAAEPNARFARGWILTRGDPLTPGVVLLLVTALPTALLIAAQAGLDLLAADAGGETRWPLWDALIAGGVLAGAVQFVAAPFSAGALRSHYAEGLRRERAGCDGPQVRAVRPPAPPPLVPERAAS